MHTIKITFFAIIHYVQDGFVSHADLGGINHLLLPHTIFNLTSKGKEMVFWQYIFSPFLGIVMS